MKKLVAAGLSLGLSTSVVTSVQAMERDLSAVRLDGPLTIDGRMDATWDAATPLMVKVNELPYKPDNGYDGMTETDVELRAMYDDEHLYIFARWDDPTHSLRRYPWQKQEDGSWKQLFNKDSTKHENTYYEDKASFFWNINERGFAKKGCDKSCHMAENGILEDVTDTSAGRHYTSKEGETIDMWHWKSARLNAVQQVDDQFVNWDRNESKNWGRHGDTSSGGGYYNNINEAGDAPMWLAAAPSNYGPLVILEDDKIPFVDTFEAGDEVGGVISRAFSGQRSDLPGDAKWEDGVWTLENKRSLTTEGPDAKLQDVQFDDLSKTYLFGVTIFDNAQINHIYHKKALKLTFE